LNILIKGGEMKKPYIKKFSTVSKFVVWLVDGEYIRKNIDEEFTNYGQHYRFKFIPKKEFWIDKERVLGEEKYYIDSMLVMTRLLSKGVSHAEAVRKADAIERRERSKSKLIRKEIKIKKQKDEVLKIIHKRLLRKLSNDNLRIWIVNGKLVRDLFFIDFVEGGHGYVYPFIPKNEIWIEEDVEHKEIKFILLHELHERNLMAKGWCYDTDTIKNLKTGKIKKSAHKSSSEIEFYCRNHPEFLNRELKKEIKKNNSLK
jgi:hypothetical protein